MVFGCFWDMLQICGILSVRARSESTLEMSLGAQKGDISCPKSPFVVEKWDTNPAGPNPELSPAPPPPGSPEKQNQ